MDAQSVGTYLERVIDRVDEVITDPLADRTCEKIGPRRRPAVDGSTNGVPGSTVGTSPTAGSGDAHDSLAAAERCRRSRYAVLVYKHRTSPRSETAEPMTTIVNCEDRVLCHIGRGTAVMCWVPITPTSLSASAAGEPGRAL